MSLIPNHPDHFIVEAFRALQAQDFAFHHNTQARLCRSLSDRLENQELRRLCNTYGQEELYNKLHTLNRSMAEDLSIGEKHSHDLPCTLERVTYNITTESTLFHLFKRLSQKTKGNKSDAAAFESLSRNLHDTYKFFGEMRRALCEKTNMHSVNLIADGLPVMLSLEHLRFPDREPFIPPFNPARDSHADHAILAAGRAGFHVPSARLSALAEKCEQLCGDHFFYALCDKFERDQYRSHLYEISFNAQSETPSLTDYVNFLFEGEETISELYRKLRTDVAASAQGSRSSLRLAADTWAERLSLPISRGDHIDNFNRLVPRMNELLTEFRTLRHELLENCEMPQIDKLRDERYPELDPVERSSGSRSVA